MKKLLMALPLLLFWACNQTDVVKIEGSIRNAEGKTLYLDKLHVAKTETVDSIQLNKDGEFDFKVKSTQPEFYILRLSNGKIITLLTEPQEQLSLLIDGNKMDRAYSVEGSKGSKLVQDLNDQLHITKDKLAAIVKEAKEKQGQPDYHRIAQNLTADYVEAIQKQREFSINFIMKNATSLSSYMALYQKVDKENYTLNENKDIKFVKIVASSMKALYPNSEYTTAILNNLSTMQSAINNMKMKKLIDQVGTNYPDISLPNTKGDSIALSSLQGKFIVLSFWSARDANSRKVNKTLKKIYSKYHGKGLEIYQVSVDQNKSQWINAIQQDKLKWINVCNPENGSAIAARTYNIQQIPSNYLIDKKGDIVGKNLYGVALEEKIQELLN
ncbi:MAG: thioredoxin-like domain-containing protein [Marinifilaceae bacterium]